jgi:hypothetical protein
MASFIRLVGLGLGVLSFSFPFINAGDRTRFGEPQSLPVTGPWAACDAFAPFMGSRDCDAALKSLGVTLDASQIAQRELTRRIIRATGSDGWLMKAGLAASYSGRCTDTDTHTHAHAQKKKRKKKKNSSPFLHI